MHAAEPVNKAQILTPFVNQKFLSTYINRRGGGRRRRRRKRYYYVRYMEK